MTHPGPPALVVGLGNPGARYAETRHNAGALVVELLAARMGGRLSPHRRTRCLVLEGRLAGARAVLATPMSYVNESGGPVKAAASFFRVPVERITVVHDELDLDFGVLRVKRGGGDGGHNGLRSLTSALDSRDYTRIRIGIGRPPGRQDPADYVLRDFPPVQRRELPLVLDRAADAVESVLVDGVEATQNAVN